MSDTTLAKSFEPHNIEAQWGPEWEKRAYAAPAFLENQKNFSIQLPPPNVTGTLHMGHAFNQTIMDGLTRYHRMLGENTLWVPGTDHAGIANSTPKVSRATTSAAKSSSNVSGTGSSSPARPSPARSGASVRPSTGRANTSPWTTKCPPPCATCSSVCMNRV
jgi:leucyl-tRNA synthetase